MPGGKSTWRGEEYKAPVCPWLFLALMLGAILRGFFLSQPMRYDESYTFLNFINGSWGQAFRYPLPNNHVLHTLLAKSAVCIWGSHPPVIRLPAFLAGLAVIPAAFMLSRRIGGPGYLAALGAAVHPYLVLYSTNARGYSLLTLLTVVLLVWTYRLAGSSAFSHVVVFSLIAALGMLVMPSMAFPLAGIFLWAMVVLYLAGSGWKEMVARFAIPAALMMGVLSALFYTPVALASGGIRPVISNPFVSSLPAEAFFARLRETLTETWSLFSRDVPVPVTFALLILFFIGMIRGVRDGNVALVSMPLCLIAGAALALALKRAVPYPRTWIYLIPVTLVLADYGLDWPIRGRSLHFYGALYIAGAVFAVSLMATGAVAKNPDTGVFPEAPAAALYLKQVMAPNDVVVVRLPADRPLQFYMWYYGVPEAGRPFSNPRRIFYVVQKSVYSLEKLTGGQTVGSVEKVLEMGDLVIYQVLEALNP